MTLYEARDIFTNEIEYFESIDNQEKANQYKNALKGVEQAIKDYEELCQKVKQVELRTIDRKELDEYWRKYYDRTKQHIFR